MSSRLSPHTPKQKGITESRGKTPKSSLKKSVFSYDTDSSYIEEEDLTYAPDETALNSDSVDDDEFEKIEEEIGEEVKNLQDELGDFEAAANRKELVDKQATTQEREAVDKELKAERESEKEKSKAYSLLRKYEVPRRILHSSIGVFTLFMYTHGFKISQITPYLVALFLVILINDFCRFRSARYNKVVVANWKFLMRKNEEHSYNATLYYLAGLILVFSVAPKDICVMSVLLLSWADPAASTIGQLFGKYTPALVDGKSLAGALASFASGVFSCLLFYGYFVPHYNAVNRPGDIAWSPETSKLSLSAFACFAGLIGSISEFIDLFGLDDNFTIPFLSSIGLSIVVYCFHI